MVHQSAAMPPTSCQVSFTSASSRADRACLERAWRSQPANGRLRDFEPPPPGACSMTALPAASTPEVLEPRRCQLGVAHGVLDVLVAEPGLQRPRVMAGIGQRIAAAMAQHVRMDRELHLGPSPDPTE